MSYLLPEKEKAPLHKMNMSLYVKKPKTKKLHSCDTCPALITLSRKKCRPCAYDAMVYRQRTYKNNFVAEGR